MKPKSKVIYKAQDNASDGSWTALRLVVAADQALASNEFDSLLALQRFVVADINARIKKLKNTKTGIKALRKNLHQLNQQSTSEVLNENSAG